MWKTDNDRQRGNEPWHYHAVSRLDALLVVGEPFTQRNSERTETVMGCTEKCWTPARCPDHGDSMTPFGRSAPIGMWQCCDNYAKSAINPRHLWDAHDSTRIYTDPAGWAEHEAGCAHCLGDTQ